MTPWESVGSAALSRRRACRSRSSKTPTTQFTLFSLPSQVRRNFPQKNWKALPEVRRRSALRFASGVAAVVVVLLRAPAVAAAADAGDVAGDVVRPDVVRRDAVHRDAVHRGVVRSVFSQSECSRTTVRECFLDPSYSQARSKLGSRHSVPREGIGWQGGGALGVPCGGVPHPLASRHGRGQPSRSESP